MPSEQIPFFSSLLNNWPLLTGSGVLATIVNWFAWGKRAKKTDALASMQALYDKFLDDYKDRMQEVITELREVKTDYRLLQGQFNSTQLAYAQEVERSQNWEKLHRELMEKYRILEKDYEELKILYEKLKEDFDIHKSKSK